MPTALDDAGLLNMLVLNYLKRSGVDAYLRPDCIRLSTATTRYTIEEKEYEYLGKDLFGRKSYMVTKKEVPYRVTKTTSEQDLYTGNNCGKISIQRWDDCLTWILFAYATSNHGRSRIQHDQARGVVLRDGACRYEIFRGDHSARATLGYASSLDQAVSWLASGPLHSLSGRG